FHHRTGGLVRRCGGGRPPAPPQDVTEQKSDAEGKHNKRRVKVGALERDELFRIRRIVDLVFDKDGLNIGGFTKFWFCSCCLFCSGWHSGWNYSLSMGFMQEYLSNDSMRIAYKRHGGRYDKSINWSNSLVSVALRSDLETAGGHRGDDRAFRGNGAGRSEERRVGNEC